MRAFMVVEYEELLQALSQLRNRCILVQVDVLILDRAPEPFHKHVVQYTSGVVHTDADAGRLQL